MVVPISASYGTASERVWAGPRRTSPTVGHTNGTPTCSLHLLAERAGQSTDFSVYHNANPCTEINIVEARAGLVTIEFTDRRDARMRTPPSRYEGSRGYRAVPTNLIAPPYAMRFRPQVKPSYVISSTAAVHVME